MQRIISIAVVLVFLAVLGLVFGYTDGYRETWVGFYDLTVHVETQGDRPRMVRCHVLTSWESAERVCRECPRAKFGPEDTVLADPFEGMPLVLSVKMTGVRLYSGRDLHRAQVRGLLVQAEWTDGRWACRAVYIPDEWETHEVQVILP